MNKLSAGSDEKKKDSDKKKPPKKIILGHDRLSGRFFYSFLFEITQPRVRYERPLHNPENFAVMSVKWWAGLSVDT